MNRGFEVYKNNIGEVSYSLIPYDLWSSRCYFRSGTNYGTRGECGYCSDSSGWCNLTIFWTVLPIFFFFIRPIYTATSLLNSACPQ